MELTEIHPAILIFYYILLALFAFLFSNPYYMITFIILMIVLIYLQGISSELINVLKIFVPLGLLIIIINPIFVNDGFHRIYVWGSYFITLEAIVYGFLMAGTFLIVLLALSSYNKAVSYQEMLYILSKKFPIIAMILVMALRFIPLLNKRAIEVEKLMKINSKSYLDKNSILDDYDSISDRDNSNSSEPGTNVENVDKSLSVEGANDNFSVEDINDSLSVEDINDSLSVEDVNDSLSVEDVNDSLSVEDISDSLSVEDISDSLSVEDINDGLSVENVKNNLNDNVSQNINLQTDSKLINKFASSKTGEKIVQNAKNIGSILAVTVSWSLEEAMFTAKSMKARGYNSTKRTSYLSFKLNKADYAFIALLIITLIIMGYGLSQGYGYINVYPKLDFSFYDLPFNIYYLAFIVFLLPLIYLELKEVWIWH